MAVKGHRRSDGNLRFIVNSSLHSTVTQYGPPNEDQTRHTICVLEISLLNIEQRRGDHDHVRIKNH